MPRECCIWAEEIIRCLENAVYERKKSLDAAIDAAEKPKWAEEMV